MKLTMKFVIVFGMLGAASAHATQTDPLAKVIQMFSELEAKIMKEGEAEEKAYKEFFAWCDDAAKNKGFDVKTATAQVEKLKATIAKCKSDIDDADEVGAKMVADIAQDEKDLEDATVIREKENAEFKAAEAELMEGIDMLERAIGVIERNMKASALVQEPIDTTSIDKMLKGLSVVLVVSIGSCTRAEPFMLRSITPMARSSMSMPSINSASAALNSAFSFSRITVASSKSFSS
jgi:hypothetical protein